MKKTVFIFLFICINGLSAQENLNFEFKNHIYNSLDSFKTVMPEKHKEILGIVVVAKLNGKLKEFKISFKSKEVYLTKKEYKWLFKLLEDEDYQKYKTIFIGEEELDDLKLLKYSIPYKGALR